MGDTVAGGGNVMCVCVCTKRVCVSNTEPKVCARRYIHYIRISVFVKSTRVIHLFTVNCLFKSKFNMHVKYYHTFNSALYAKFHAKNII